jgi:hypothetical protein
VSEVKDPEVHPAIELLLARMESNPEEFIGGGGWEKVINHYRRNFTEKEKELFFIKERELSMECFHQEIMRKMLSEPNAVWSDPTLNVIKTPGGRNYNTHETKGPNERV